MADYLLRHPSQYEQYVVKAEEKFKNWVTINVVDEFAPTLNKAKPIRMQESEKKLHTKVLTVHAPVHKLSQSKQVAKLPERNLMTYQNTIWQILKLAGCMSRPFTKRTKLSKR